MNYGSRYNAVWSVTRSLVADMSAEERLLADAGAPAQVGALRPGLHPRSFHVDRGAGPIRSPLGGFLPCDNNGDRNPSLLGIRQTFVS
jgi:hypothetical protein